MFRTTSDTSTTASPLSTPNLKSSKKSSFMVLSSSDRDFATIPDCARRVHSLPAGPGHAFGLPLRWFLWYTYYVRDRIQIGFGKEPHYGPPVIHYGANAQSTHSGAGLCWLE